MIGSVLTYVKEGNIVYVINLEFTKIDCNNQPHQRLIMR